MNGNDWTNYFYDLHQHIRQQDNKIKQLEFRLREMEENDQDRPNTTIEKIEYNFDQLKIERLDGTLHIGLTPSDPENIDDFGVNKEQSGGNSPTAMEHTLQSDLQQQIHQDGPAIIQH